MNPLDEYKSKLISLEEAVGMLQSNQTVGIGIAASEPVGLLGEMAKQAERLENVTLWTCLPMRAYDIFMQPEMDGHFFNENWFYGAPDRKVHPEGRVSYTPNNLHLAAQDKLYGTGGKLNVFLGTCTPPNENGYVSISLGAVVERELIDAADLVVLEVNRKLPWTEGDTVIPLSLADYFVEYDTDLVTTGTDVPTEIEEKIGRHLPGCFQQGGKEHTPARGTNRGSQDKKPHGQRVAPLQPKE